MTVPSESSSDSPPDFSFLGDDAPADVTEEGTSQVEDLSAFEFGGLSSTNIKDNSEGDGFSGFDLKKPTATVPEVSPVVAQPPKAHARHKEPSGPPANEVVVVNPQKAASATRRLAPGKTQADSTAKTVDQAAPKRPASPEKPKDASADAHFNTLSAHVSDAQGVDAVSKKSFSIVVGYAAALTLLFLALLGMGRISVFGAHPLESLPDIRPLQNNEFQHVPVSAVLPGNHALKLGESRRFGDIILTAERVTREPVTFAHMTTGAEAPNMATGPVLKLWLKMENASSITAFPPYELGLMCRRSPKEGTDESTAANSWLMATQIGSADSTRILNLLHSPESSFDLAGQNSRRILQPGETMETFVACDQRISDIKSDVIESFRWRVQIRKGVNQKSGHGVTTLVDVSFSPNDIQS